MSITLGEWLHVTREAYLRAFIPDGGSAVKLVVDEEPSGRAIECLAEEARDAGYVVATVDSTVTRVDKIDQLFFAVARQVDWHGLAADVRQRAIYESGYILPDMAFNPPITFESIAAVNGVASHFVRNELSKWFTEKLFRDYGMSQDFRMAVTLLCFEPLEGSGAGRVELLDNIIDWLRGDLRLLSSIRPALIFQKVARHNARDLLLSLAHWVEVAGRTGLVVAVDIRALAATNRSQLPEGSNFYSRAAVMDLYELLRQFIDSTDEMEYCFVLAVASPDFLTDERRGLEMYRALEMRVADEVRDSHRDNPLASLVRLSRGD
ncbi:MAG: DUF2791 family P-loop domain-containing protein [Chloroflexi bacterium]|nr:DUF2791 family P-loop domain-containing protein [Chloroflexota bacterium]